MKIWSLLLVFLNIRFDSRRNGLYNPIKIWTAVVKVKLYTKVFIREPSALIIQQMFYSSNVLFHPIFKIQRLVPVRDISIILDGSLVRSKLCEYITVCVIGSLLTQKSHLRINSIVPIFLNCPLGRQYQILFWLLKKCFSQFIFRTTFKCSKSISF